jgi:hypothetical protein
VAARPLVGLDALAGDTERDVSRAKPSAQLVVVGEGLEDLIVGLGPGERSGVLVPGVDPVVDAVLKGLDEGVDAAADVECDGRCLVRRDQ